MTEALRRRARRCGFEIVELNRIDGHRFLIVDQRGLTLRGSDEKPLAEADVRRFLTRFDNAAWLP